jgi:hypothetical protein
MSKQKIILCHLFIKDLEWDKYSICFCLYLENLAFKNGTFKFSL